jgi:hypothetical protein
MRGSAKSVPLFARVHLIHRKRSPFPSEGKAFGERIKRLPLEGKLFPKGTDEVAYSLILRQGNVLK